MKPSTKEVGVGWVYFIEGETFENQLKNNYQDFKDVYELPMEKFEPMYSDFLNAKNKIHPLLKISLYKEALKFYNPEEGDYIVHSVKNKTILNKKSKLKI